VLNKIEPYMRFTGEADRREYWSVMLYSTLALGLWFFITTMFGLPLIMIWLALFPVLIMQWATYVRRLNHIGLSWWWLLLIFVPYMGLIGFVLLGVLPQGMFERG
jgi:uncharacterized membrane protein YhaH (DUF805 family)